MRRRLARKIVKFAHSGRSRFAVFNHYSVDQVRRAALRVFERPLFIALDRGDSWSSPAAARVARAVNGRAMLLTGRVGVFETRRGLWEVRRRNGKIQIEDRLRPPQVTTPTY